MTSPTAITTTQTYASVANAEIALTRVCDKIGREHADIRWMVAVAGDGRFAPCVIGVTDKAGRSNITFAFNGVMVLG